jgi:hypothetical protein
MFKKYVLTAETALKRQFAKISLPRAEKQLTSSTDKDGRWPNYAVGLWDLIPIAEDFAGIGEWP